MSGDPVSTKPSWLEGWLLRLGTLGELLALLVRGGRWWMLPLVLLLAAIAVALVLLQGIPYVAPFIYMVF
jgi:hypothetical protein